PLQGICAGLRAIDDRADVVFVCGIDAPLLHPALVRHVIASLGDDDEVALPYARGYAHPLTAAYRTTVAGRLEALLRQDVLSTKPFLERCRVRRLDRAALLADPDVARLDPALYSLLNLNAPGEYDAARARPAPEISVTGRGTICAATLAAAGDGPATVNGRAVSDPEEPLVAGDVVTFADHR
ncbi:MAG: NTP transferase domain-containing protein, partial [Solirubrobacteraceae bacterium]